MENKKQLTIICNDLELIDKLKDFCEFEGVELSVREENDVVMRLPGMDDIPTPFVGAEVIPINKFRETHVMKVLKMAKGNHSKAAKKLGVSRSTLYRLLKKYGKEAA